MRNRVRRKNEKTIGIRILIILLIIAGTLTTAAFIGWKAFVLKQVDVIGNEIYSDEQIENWVLSKNNSWNTLYLVIENKLRKQEEIPFVDNMDIKLVSPTEIEVEVTEKGVLGYVFVDSLEQNAYFDQDGFVVEFSNDEVNGVTQISGLDVEDAVLYEKLDLGGSSMLKTLLSLTQLLKKYDLIPENIDIEGSRIFLNYGTIRVSMGTGVSLNEKILRLEQILPQLEGKSGTLHLDTWSESGNTIYFTPAVRTLALESDPAAEETAEEEETFYYSDEEIISYEEEYYYYGDDYFEDDYYEDDYYVDDYYYDEGDWYGDDWYADDGYGYDDWYADDGYTDEGYDDGWDDWYADDGYDDGWTDYEGVEW